MLIEFAVENFRSIKDRAVLSMVATADKSLPNNIVDSGVLKKDKLLKSAVIYGANASGKTNVIFGLNYLRKIVLTSHEIQRGTTLNCTPFKLNKRKMAEPSKFEIYFIKDNIKYAYGVSLTNSKIMDEYLYYWPNSRKALIFSRTNTKDYEFRSTDPAEQTLNAQRTPENVLYLSRTTQLNYSKTKPVFDWFKNNLKTIGPTDHPALEGITADLLKNPKYKEMIIRGLNEADLGIDDVTSHVKELDTSEVPFIIIKQKKEELEEDKVTFTTREITMFHRGVPFDLNREESEGTQRLFSVIGPWILALMKGQILVVDELDTKLHHLLNVFLINLIHDPAQNRSNAQLIFTTHNVNLLSQDIFRRDQIWFTDKDSKTGATSLYSLAEYSVRKGQDIEKGYLLGKFGAVPYIPTGRIVE